VARFPEKTAGGLGKISSRRGRREKAERLVWSPRRPRREKKRAPWGSLRNKINTHLLNQIRPESMRGGYGNALPAIHHQIAVVIRKKIRNTLSKSICCLNQHGREGVLHLKKKPCDYYRKKPQRQTKTTGRRNFRRTDRRSYQATRGGSEGG